MLFTNLTEKEARKIRREFNNAEYFDGKPAVIQNKIIPFLERVQFPKIGYVSEHGYGTGHGSDKWRVSSGLSPVERLAVIAGYPVEIRSETRFRWIATYSNGYWGHMRMRKVGRIW